jgi:hypothetical protein
MNECMLCNNIVRAKGFCAAHYNKYCRPLKGRHGTRRKWSKKTICTIENCGFPEYSKGYCKPHYMQLYRKGVLFYPTRCIATGCDEIVRTRFVCKKHKWRYINPLKGKVIGEAHWSYKNGNSYFQDHSFVRKIRLRLIKERGSHCQQCGKMPAGIGLHQHHIDGNKTNHDEANLTLLCHVCHRGKHKGKRKKNLYATV